jgi:hypothetical protein
MTAAAWLIRNTGAFKQTTQKFHRIFGKPLSIIGFCQFRPSQFSAHSKAGFLGDAASPMESTNRSSEKSNSPCKLKCCQVTAEPWRMASISSARRFSFFSARQCPQGRCRDCLEAGPPRAVYPAITRYRSFAQRARRRIPLADGKHRHHDADRQVGRHTLWRALSQQTPR